MALVSGASLGATPGKRGRSAVDESHWLDSSPAEAIHPRVIDPGSACQFARRLIA